MADTDQRAAMTAFLETFNQESRLLRGEFLADDVVVNHWAVGLQGDRGKRERYQRIYNSALGIFPLTWTSRYWKSIWATTL